MPARRFTPVPRAALAATLVACIQGCSGAPPAPARAEPALCAPDHLDACEARLVASPSRPLAAAYAEARAARDASDPWAKLHHDLEAPDRGPRPTAVLVAEGSPAPAVAGVRAVTVPVLPAPATIPADALLLALAEAAGYEHVVRLQNRGGGTVVTQLFPGDPLAPFMGGLRPALHDDGSLGHLDADLASEEALRAAFAAASAFHYVDAARAADQLAALIGPADGATEPVLRRRYALQLLGAAGLVLDPEKSAAATPAPAAPRAPEPDDTPYGSYLHVVTAKDSRKEWEVRAATVLSGIAADRREAFASLFDSSHGQRTCTARQAPPVEDVRDLVLAGDLGRALPRDLAAPLAAGQLPLREWLARYEALVGIVERTGSAWSYLPALLSQRGEAPGLSAAGTPLYRRVTELGMAHLAATQALQQAYPARYRAFTPIGLATSPGALGDEALRRALIRLTEASVQDKLAAAEDAEALLLGLVTGAAAGLSYPPALQEAHFLALASALTARLQGDFLHRTGWDVALLYALDAGYHLFAGLTPRLGFSSEQIARSLAGVEPHALASLATAAARYAALAGEGRLDASASPERLAPERRAARDGLRAALAQMGAPGEAPNNVLDNVTTLADGLVATLSTAIAAGAARRERAVHEGTSARDPRAKRSPTMPPKEAAAVTCARKETALPLDPALRRALARLGDVRRRILSHPRYQKGDGLWVRRVRLLVTVLSDAMDLVLAGDARKTPVLTVPPGEAERVVEEALRELDQPVHDGGSPGKPGPAPMPPAVTEVIAGGYGILREVVAAGDPEELVKKGGRDLKRAAGGLFALFRGDAHGGQGPALDGTHGTLLDALAAIRLAEPSSDDPMAALAAYATAFYEKKQTDRGDLCLLAALVLSPLTGTRPPPAVLDLAARSGSRVAWVWSFTGEVRPVHDGGSPGKPGSAPVPPGRSPDPSAYAESMRKATDDACQVPDAEATLAVMQAVHDALGGKRGEARAALDRVLDRAEEKGLGVPRMIYRYEEKTATKVFTASVDLSYGSGILLGGTAFQLGLGLRSPGDPGGSLSATLAPLETAQAGEDAGRYYVYTAALATVYHLLDGDVDHALVAAQRAVVALSAGLKLGSRVLPQGEASWGEDSRAVLVVAAQLAAEAGLPFLAGDLWTVVRQGLSPTLDDKDVARALDRLPLGLAGIPDLAPVVDRARRSLAVLAEPLPCTDAKVELGGFEEVACAEYPLALSLRIADALKKLPRLRHGGHCGPLHSLDAFLGGAARGAYDPDAFTRAEEDLRADGKLYDAAILLTRQKNPNHCNPTLVAAARALGRSALLGPSVRSDLLGAAVNCTAAAGGPEVTADILALDEETQRLPDPSRNLRMVLSIADLAARTDAWETLGKLVEKPDFVGRWMSVHPDAAAAGLVLEGAMSAIEGQAAPPERAERAEGSRQLLCETFKAPEREEVCGLLESLRAPFPGPAAERQRRAKEAVKKLLASMAAPPEGRAKRP